MNTHSIHSSFSPFQFLTRKFNQFTRIRGPEEPGIHRSRAESNQTALTGNPQKITENQIVRGIEKTTGADRISSQDDLSKSKLAAAQISQFQGFSAQINQSAEIEVVTKEGDVIKIRLAQSASNSQSSVNIEQDGHAASAMQSKSESSAGFSVSIEGNLNEDEQKSLKHLLTQMDEVGQDFFNGNIQSAFNHAQKIGLDSEQIASFSMSLSMEKSIQAVAAYQQTGFPDRQIEPEKIKQAADFFSQARELLKTAQEALEPFENPLSVFSALFNAVNQVGIEKSIEPKSVEGTAALQQIIEPLGEIVLETDKPVQA